MIGGLDRLFSYLAPPEKDDPVEAIDARDRRRAARNSVKGTAVVSWVTSEGEARESVASVSNASSEGLQVELVHTLDVGCKVTVEGGAVRLACSVRHCSRIDEAHFQAGLQIVDTLT